MWVESSGRRKAEEWGLGKRDLRVSVGGVAPAPRSWNQGGEAAMGEEVDLGRGQTARAAWGAEKVPEGQQGLLGPHWGTDQSPGRLTQAAGGKGAAVGLVGCLEEVL